MPWKNSDWISWKASKQKSRGPFFLLWNVGWAILARLMYCGSVWGFLFLGDVSFDFCGGSVCQDWVHEECHYRNTSLCLHSCKKLHCYGLIICHCDAVCYNLFAATKNLTHIMNIWKLNIFEYELLKPLLLPESLSNNLQVLFPEHQHATLLLLQRGANKSSRYSSPGKKEETSEKW